LQVQTIFVKPRHRSYVKVSLVKCHGQLERWGGGDREKKNFTNRKNRRESGH